MCLLSRETLEKLFVHLEQSWEFCLASILGTSDFNKGISLNVKNSFNFLKLHFHQILFTVGS